MVDIASMRRACAAISRMPDRMARRLPIVLLLGAVALTLSACGHKEKPSAVHFAPTEGIYVTAGQLKYQIQISRQLNEYDEEDSQYLMGVSKAIRHLGPEDTWFGVFIRVENPTDTDLRASTSYRIVDTLGRVYRPSVIDTNANPIAFYPAVIPPHQVLPHSNQLAAQTSIGGELLLFKVKVAGLDNRPLVLRIGPGAKQTGPGATIDLDV
jgi:hypothetical protein